MGWIKNLTEMFLIWAPKAWKAIKSLPGWAVVALLTCGALVVHLLKKNVLLKRRTEVQIKLKDITIEHAVATTSAEKRLSDEAARLREERDAKHDELDDIEREIDEASKKGPVALAAEWKNYLSGKKP